MLVLCCSDSDSHDNGYDAVIMALPLWELTRFVIYDDCGTAPGGR